jgi:hypothetical protein
VTDGVTMQRAIMKRALDRGEIEALLNRGDQVNIEAELAAMPPEDVAAIRSGAAPLPSPEDGALIACLSNCRLRWARDRKAAEVVARGGGHHPEEYLKMYGQAAPIDLAIIPLITEVWRAGLKTVHSCQSHAIRDKIWIEFGTAREAVNFVDIVAPYEGDPNSIFQRVVPWYFGMYGHCAESRNLDIPREKRDRESWEFHVTAYATESDFDPSIGFSVSVLFPEHDLPTVLQRMKDRNAEVLGAE